MNAKRVSYVLPRHEIIITGNYLVGFTRGDGSFYFNKQDPTVVSGNYHLIQGGFQGAGSRVLLV